MEQRKTSAVLFDLDGTLWDSAEGVAESWNRIFAAEGLALRMTAEDVHGIMGKTLPEIGAALLPELPAPERDALMDLCGRDEVEYLRRRGGRLYPGLRETLEALRERYALAVVSNCQTGYVGAFLEAHGLDGLFDDYEEWGRTGRSKGENIRLVLERLGVRRAVYVGDTAGDEAAADQAGLPFLHAAYGFGASRHPVAVLRRLDELPATLDSLGIL